MKTIKAIVDPKGNVHVDFVGYVGEECAAAEEAFRRALAEFGLRVTVIALRRKDADDMSGRVPLFPDQNLKLHERR